MRRRHGTEAAGASGAGGPRLHQINKEQQLDTESVIFWGRKLDWPRGGQLSLGKALPGIHIKCQ